MVSPIPITARCLLSGLFPGFAPGVLNVMVFGLFAGLVFGFTPLRAQVVSPRSGAPERYFAYPDSNTDSSGLLVRIQGEYQASSNAVSHAFANRLVLGGFIDDEIKDGTERRLDADNRFEVLGRGELFFAWKGKPADGSLWWLASIGYTYMQQVHFSDDLFRLVYYGNAGFAGSSVSLDGLELHNLNYQHARFGVRKSFKREGGEFVIGADLGFLQGLGQFRGNVERGSIYTAEDGSRIDLDLAFELNVSDNEVPRANSLNGLGFVGSLYLAMEWDKPALRLELVAEDLGWASWNNPGLDYTADSMWSFDGFDLDELRDLNEGLGSDLDSLLGELGVVASDGAYGRVLPADLHLRIGKTWPQAGVDLTMGAEYRAGLFGRPLLYLKGRKAFERPGLGLGATLAWGGFGGFQAGLDLAWCVADDFALLVGSNQVTSWFAPKSISGPSLYTAIEARF